MTQRTVPEPLARSTTPAPSRTAAVASERPMETVVTRVTRRDPVLGRDNIRNMNRSAAP